MGRIDIVFAPVDGTLTLDTDGMIEVLQGMKAQLVIPMHFFSSFTLHRFLDSAKSHKWDVEFAPVPTTTVSKATLPATPKVLVLPGR
jgi:L-ascorbate metabolism protein UlaG (beta-lactamase superfamily)